MTSAGELKAGGEAAIQTINEGAAYTHAAEEYQMDVAERVHGLMTALADIAVQAADIAQDIETEAGGRILLAGEKIGDATRQFAALTEGSSNERAASVLGSLMQVSADLETSQLSVRSTARRVEAGGALAQGVRS